MSEITIEEIPANRSGAILAMAAVAGWLALLLWMAIWLGSLACAACIPPMAWVLQQLSVQGPGTQAFNEHFEAFSFRVTYYAMMREGV